MSEKRTQTSAQLIKEIQRKSRLLASFGLLLCFTCSTYTIVEHNPLGLVPAAVGVLLLLQSERILKKSEKTILEAIIREETESSLEELIPRGDKGRSRYWLN